MLFFLSLVLITSYVLRLIIIKKSYLNSDNWSDWGINNLQGIGSPVFDKLGAELAKAMLSLPASKGFEIGSGFAGKELFLDLAQDQLALLIIGWAMQPTLQLD